VELDVGVLVRLDHARGEDALGAVERGERLAQLAHVAADRRLLLDEDDLVLLERAGTRLQATLADLRAYLDTEFWNEVAGDYTIDSTDAGALIATTGMSGAQANHA
jgi:hypothetical protein